MELEGEGDDRVLGYGDSVGRELLFFFSSRRRHTRLQGDWSSDVCSSDLDAWSNAIVQSRAMSAKPRRWWDEQAPRIKITWRELGLRFATPRQVDQKND